MALGVWGATSMRYYSSDRKGTTKVNGNSARFHRWVSDFSLIDLPLTNLKHTWSNFRTNASCSKLDRIFVSKDWQSCPKVHLKGIPRVVSDHCPLLLATYGPKWGPMPFRFENMWFQHKSFKESILSWGNQPQTQVCAAFRLQKKLLFIKEKMKTWNPEVFSSLAQQKEILSQQIDHLDQKSDSGLTQEELGLQNKLKEEIQDIAYKEEISWK